MTKLKKLKILKIYADKYIKFWIVKIVLIFLPLHY